MKYGSMGPPDHTSIPIMPHLHFHQQNVHWTINISLGNYHIWWSMWFKFEAAGVSFIEDIGVGENSSYRICRTKRAMHHMSLHKGTSGWRGLCLQDKDKKD